MTRGPISLIDAIVAAPNDAAQARLLRDGARDLLFDHAAIPDIATPALDSADGAAMQAAAALLARALDEARMAMENDAPEGSALIDTLDEALTARDTAAPFTPALRLRLAQIYGRAGLAPPQFAMLTADVMTEAPTGSEEMPDLGALIDPILQEIGDEPLQVHGALVELLAGLPPELAEMLVSMTIARPVPWRRNSVSTGCSTRNPTFASPRRRRLCPGPRQGRWPQILAHSCLRCASG